MRNQLVGLEVVIAGLGIHLSIGVRCNSGRAALVHTSHLAAYTYTSGLARPSAMISIDKKYSLLMAP